MLSNMAQFNLTPEQWRLAGQANPLQRWTQIPVVEQTAQTALSNAEKDYDEAPVKIAQDLTKNAKIDTTQDISGQMAGIRSEAYGAARGAREALGGRANALRSMLNMPEYQPTGNDNSANTVRTIENATDEQFASSHPNAIAMQRAKLLQRRSE